MRSALKIDEKNFGADHPDVAIDLTNLGQLLFQTNRAEEAEPIMQRALRIDQKTLGEHHPQVAIDLYNLAVLYKATNRAVQAIPLMQKAVEVCKTSLGPNHIHTQGAKHILEEMENCENS